MTDDTIDRIQDVLIAKLGELDPADVEQAARYVALIREVGEWRSPSPPPAAGEKPKRKRKLSPERLAALQEQLTCQQCGSRKSSKAHKEGCGPKPVEPEDAKPDGDAETAKPDDGHPWRNKGLFEAKAAANDDGGKLAPGPVSGDDGHVHHWIIQHVEGRGQVGTCRECDEERVYDPPVVTGFSERGEGVE